MSQESGITVGVHNPAVGTELRATDGTSVLSLWYHRGRYRDLHALADWIKAHVPGADNPYKDDFHAANFLEGAKK